jgi:predicted enzyme related to lactoylglutathione lyase
MSCRHADGLSLYKLPFKEALVSTTATGIGSVSLVCIATPEQDGAIAFYESLGFEKRADVPMGGGYRWVEVYPPSGPTGIALAPPRPGTEVTPGETGIILTSEDIDSTHDQFKALGVDVDAEVSRMGDPVPPMFWFRDPTGHSLMVVEQR